MGQMEEHYDQLVDLRQLLIGQSALVDSSLELVYDRYGKILHDMNDLSDSGLPVNELLKNSHGFLDQIRMTIHLVSPKQKAAAFQYSATTMRMAIDYLLFLLHEHFLSRQ